MQKRLIYTVLLTALMVSHTIPASAESSIVAKERALSLAIDEAQSRKLLKQRDANKLRTQLEHIRERERSLAKDGKLTPSDETALNAELQKVAAAVPQSAQLPQAPAANSAFESTVEQQLSAAEVSGRMTMEQTYPLRRELLKIRSDEANLISAGKFDQRAQAMVAAQLKQLQAKIK